MDESGSVSEFGEYIGRTRLAEDLITPQLVERFRACFEPHLAPAAVVAVAPSLHWCLAPDVAATGALGGDGHPAKGEFLPPVPLPRRMWAGGEVETFDGLRSGDKVTRSSRVTGIAMKHGRSGTLCFVTVTHELSTARGLAIRDRQDFVYREPSSMTGAAAPAAAAESAPVPKLRWTIEPSTVLLFRYSALTFNGHRIHYDLPYAREVEDYPNLVVQGPLQATLLINLYTVLGGSVSPLIAPDRFQAEAHDAARLAPGALECRVNNSSGRVTMLAEAYW